MTKQTEEWEKKFDTLFNQDGPYWKALVLLESGSQQPAQDKVKDFIRSLKSQWRDDVRNGMVQEMKHKFKVCRSKLEGNPMTLAHLKQAIFELEKSLTDASNVEGLKG